MRMMVRVFALVICTSLLPAQVHAQGPAPISQKPLQGAKITTPTRAFLKRQCAALKRLITNIPGMRKIMAIHHDPRRKK